jgi:hypothetical protein
MQDAEMQDVQDVHSASQETGQLGQVSIAPPSAALIGLASQLQSMFRQSAPMRSNILPTSVGISPGFHASAETTRNVSNAPGAAIETILPSLASGTSLFPSLQNRDMYVTRLTQQAQQDAALSALRTAAQTVAQGSATQAAPSAAAPSPTLLQRQGAAPQGQDRLQTATGQAPRVQAAQTSSSGLQGTVRYCIVNGQPMLVPSPYVEPSPAVRTTTVKMPAPPKFCGAVDADITNVELWARDVQRFAQRSNIIVQEALEILTSGDARVQVDNMLRDPRMAQLPEQQFVDRFVMHFRTQVRPRNERARAELHSGQVCMVPGGRLHTYVSRFRSVILDAAPMEELDQVYWFQAGLTAELRVECHTDVHGEQFTALEDLIKHAFVQEEKLAYKVQARIAQNRTNAELNYVQRAHTQSDRTKRVRSGDQQYASSERDEHGGHRNSGPSSSGRTALEKAIYHLGMEFGVCGGCLGLLGDDRDHFWSSCPLNPKNARDAE